MNPCPSARDPIFLDPVRSYINPSGSSIKNICIRYMTAAKFLLHASEKEM